MKDITSKEDIRLMVDAFYEKVNRDELLSPVFNDFVGVHWDTHLPKMYDFWAKLLLGDTAYKGSPFDKHLPLPIEGEHFDRWLRLFTETLDEHFAGPKAEEARMKARSIADIFRFKMKTLKSV